MKNVWLWLAAAGIGLVFGCLGVLFQVLSALPQSITEDGLRAHCAVHNGVWIESVRTNTTEGAYTFSTCTEESATYGDRTMPRGYIYVWWNRTTGEVTIND